MQILQDCCIGTHMPWWFAVSTPLSPTSGISPSVIPPQPPHPNCPSPSPLPHNIPQCVMFPSLCPGVLIIQHPPMSESSGVWFSVLVSFLFYCTLSSGIHVQILQDCCIGTHMPWWFAASIPQSPTSGVSPSVVPT